MPKEVRRLVFAHQETTDAVIEYGKKFNISFPPGRIIRAKYANDSVQDLHTMQKFKSDVLKDYNVQEKKGSIIVTFFDETTFEHKFYNFTADMISGALIEFCIKNHIMLPKNAGKSLDVTEFNICLDIHYDHGVKSGTAPLSFE